MNKNVLIVDDQVFIRNILKLVLKKNGYIVDEAENGKLGLEKIKQKKYDLIMLDLMMPEMGGLEVLDNISSDETLKNIPVIILSAKGQQSDIDLALKKGAIKYISKPFDIKKLPNQIFEALEQHSVISKINTLNMNDIDNNLLNEILLEIKQKNIKNLDNKLIKFLFSNISIDNKISILSIIGNQNIVKAKPIVLNIINNETNQLIKDKAIWAISQISDSSVVDKLYSIAIDETENLQTRIVSCIAIQNLGKSEMINSLFEKLNEELEESL